MKTIRFFLLMLAVAIPAIVTASDTPTATKWNLDRSHSNLTFSVRHFFTPVVGKFNAYTLDLTFDQNNLDASSVSVEIDVNSINTDNERRDDHLRNPDFFETEKFPKITFVSSSIKKTGDNTFVATGDLTVKDVTKTIELPFTLLGIQDHPNRENTLIGGFEGSIKLNRLDYGVGTGNFVSTAVVADEVTVNIFLEMTASK